MSAKVYEALRLDEPERAYLAGIFDGEGYVGIEREVRKDRGGKVRYRVSIAVSNTDRAVVELMLAKVKHGFISTTTRPEGTNWKPLHAWRTKGGSALFVLNMILPHLKIKLPQATVALDGPATEDKWQEIKRMNHRGVTGGEHDSSG